MKKRLQLLAVQCPRPLEVKASVSKDNSYNQQQFSIHKREIHNEHAQANFTQHHRFSHCILKCTCPNTKATFDRNLAERFRQKVTMVNATHECEHRR